MLGWGFVVGGAAAAVLGVAALLTSNERARDYNADSTCTGRADEPDACTSAAGAARDWKIASVGSFAVAGALATAGVVIVLWKSPAAPVSVQLAPGPRSAQLDFTRRF